MARCKAEQETTITYDSEEQLVRIFSARLGDQGKLRRAGVKPTRGSISAGYFYTIPSSWLKWRVSNPTGRRMRAVSQRSLDNLRGKTGT